MAKTVDDMATSVAVRAHDASEGELDHNAYISLINDAIDDLVAAGWLVYASEDVSLTVAETTYGYAVPLPFAYVTRLIFADSNGEYPLENEINGGQWRIALMGNVPKFYFAPDGWDAAPTGRAMRVIGQRRPQQNVNGSAIIHPGMESFIRERATAYALEILGEGISELAVARQRRAERLMAYSEQKLGQHVMEFRVKPDSVYVPGR